MHTVETGSRDIIRKPLRQSLGDISERCIRCDLCQKECAFLVRYGKPKDIAESYDPTDTRHLGMPFECSLCQLCAAVCPVKINPADMFLEMRRETVSRGAGEYAEHAVILGYEGRGTSRKYTYYTLPKGCDTVFFPGCTLSGTRSDKVIKVYEHLRQHIPSIGMVLDCCTKPSHDLGREAYMTAMFGEMKLYLQEAGVKTVLVACPNCYKVFSRYGAPLSVRTVYELLAEHGLTVAQPVDGTVTVHDSCAVRFEEGIHAAVRNLIADSGLTVEEMPHTRTKTLCCGEGGAVGFLSPELAGNWGKLRRNEINGKRTITYCAGCANYLNSMTPTSHVLDLLFEPEAALTGKSKVSRAPLTCLNRLKLKNLLKKESDGAVTRERAFTAGVTAGRGGAVKFGLFLLFVIGAFTAVKLTGAAQFLEQERLRAWIEGHGALAPIIYMLTYTVAPALFLPGLPITVVGGILFGPFWGVVYTITSATAGACVAFLVSRYLAREWVESKLRSPRWRKLDEGVERHGWKVVAFTRLIPLFPFNLLNYAFGLTKIPFLHYAVTTFFCMLPACIAFIVFSSSLLDLVRGRVSPWFIAGIALIVAVTLIPFFYRKYKAKTGIEDPL